MALSITEISSCLAEIGAFIEKRRPPEAIRDQLDYQGELKGSEVIFSTLRPVWNGNGEKRAFPFARVKWIQARQVWLLYWMRGNLKWHLYEPSAELSTLQMAIDEIDKDVHGCFFG